MGVDVAALTALLDGKYADVRRLVRANLAEHADILLDAEELSRSEFRRRVLEVVVIARAKSVTAMVNELCTRVRPICRDLVDAFAVPREVLRAEII